MAADLRGWVRDTQYEAHFRNLIETGRQDTFTTTEAVRAQLARQIGLHYTPPVGTPLTIAGSGSECSISIGDGLAMPALMSSARSPHGIVIGLHGYASSPEAVFDPTDGGTKGFGTTLLGMGYHIVAPQIVCSTPGDALDRNHLDRLAQLAGYSIIGFELLCLMRLVDSLLHYNLPIYVCGYSQGASTALHLGALDPRIAGVACCSWFCNRQNKILSPESWSYGSAEEYDKFNPYSAPLWPDWLLGALCCPRPLLITSGSQDIGRPIADIQTEFAKVDAHYSVHVSAGKAKLHIGDGNHEVFLDAVTAFFAAF